MGSRSGSGCTGLKASNPVSAPFGKGGDANLGARSAWGLWKYLAYVETKGESASSESPGLARVGDGARRHHQGAESGAPARAAPAPHRHPARRARFLSTRHPSRTGLRLPARAFGLARTQALRIARAAARTAAAARRRADPDSAARREHRADLARERLPARRAPIRRIAPACAAAVLARVADGAYAAGDLPGNADASRPLALAFALHADAGCRADRLAGEVAEEPVGQPGCARSRHPRSCTRARTD